MRSLLVLVSTVSALDYSSLELEEGAGRQIFTSGGVAYLALNQTFALLIGRSLYTNQPTMDPAIDTLTLTFTYVCKWGVPCLFHEKLHWSFDNPNTGAPA